MNIVIINQYAGHPELGMEFRPYALAREWVDAGHHVTIIGGSFSHLRRKQPDCAGLWSRERREGVDYLWFWGNRYPGNGLWRGLNVMWFSFLQIALAPLLALVLRPDVVIASSTHNVEGLGAWLLARLARGRLIYEVHDLWPLSLIVLGGMRESHPFVRLVQHCEDFLCRHSDEVVSILPRADLHLRERGMPAGRYSHIPNGVDFAVWERQLAQPRQAEHFEVLARLRAEGKFLVGYCGGHSVSNSLELLVRAAEHLRTEPYQIVLIGDGPVKAELERLAVELSLSNVTFLPSIAKAMIPHVLAELDVLYSGLQQCDLFRIYGISPNKLFEFMAAGRPILSPIQTDDDLVLKAGAGWCVPTEDPALLAERVRAFRAMTADERQEMGKRGQAFVRKYHDAHDLAEGFLKTCAAGR